MLFVDNLVNGQLVNLGFCNICPVFVKNGYNPDKMWFVSDTDYGREMTNGCNLKNQKQIGKMENLTFRCADVVY